jgi:hypothetical protein
MHNIMVDLETLGTDPNAVILSIGAVYFDADNLGAEFHRVLEIESQQQRGREVNPKTVEWWAGQSEQARAIFTAPSMLTFQALDEFTEFCGDQDISVWGNGADFDCVLLGSLYESFGKKRPWSYSKNRCFRTLKNTVVRESSNPLPERLGVHHDALDDAKYQALCAQVYFKGKLRLE